MVNYPIGDLVAERVRAMGVTPFYKRFEHDGARGPTSLPSIATAVTASVRRSCSTTAATRPQQR
jgi:hypothetical protein